MVRIVNKLVFWQKERQEARKEEKRLEERNEGTITRRRMEGRMN